ncbi:hypothetical protein FHP29_16895 [Nocardioides albidus]|uniref:Aromatic-ring-hydroxylating dioxygenase subunit beta n=1 Tax=Nocardioides albidus TaxID=1517589 RepID=A0A5C4VNK6_9ACTN|nr:aromatic-ring-hydroxylating dioxygenase subunit beta [Nocardioides albidus]TNM37493.1 hypothetical protein FHP29_16895 [Nocardioides albidus]
MTEAATTLPAAGTLSITDPRVIRAIELVWREATLLDAKDYHAWEALYADDGIYVVPIDRDADSFDDRLNMVYDDARMRSMRVVRMTEGFAIAAVDAATTVRTVSRFVPTTVTDDEVSLKAAQILVAFKRGRHDFWAGDVDYVVRLGADAGADRLVRKVVRLIDAEGAVPAAGFLL